MAPKQRPQPLAEELAALFGDGADNARRVLTCIESNPTRRWSIDDLIDATGLGVVEVMLIVARLTHAGLVHHDGVGDGYRSTAASSTELPHRV